MNDYPSVRARLLALVPAEQLPYAEFELRLLTTTLESDHLRDIHQHWRPIADERDQLRAQLAAPDEPLETRRAARDRNEAAQTKYDALLKKYTDLQDSYTELQELYAALQRDCDDLLADKQPRRAT